jgi:hypothetical protein
MINSLGSSLSLPQIRMYPKLVRVSRTYLHVDLCDPSVENIPLELQLHNGLKY